MNTLKAEKRSLDVKAKKLRREGFVVGNVFGKEIKESVPIQMNKSDVDHLLKTCHKGSQLNLNIDGTVYNVLIKEIDYNPVKRQFDLIDFQALVSNEKVNSSAEVVLLNEDKVKEGIVQLFLHEISFKALPSALVDKVEIDVAAMEPGDFVKVSDLDLAGNKDIDLITDLDARILTVTTVNNDIEETAADTADDSEVSQNPEA